MNKQWGGLISGPVIFLILFYGIPENVLPHAQRAILSSTVWIALWWITEAVPIAVSALLPIVLFPLSGGLDVHATASAYGNPMIFLFIGGFIIAVAIERWHLHKRIALHIIVLMGTDSAWIILGFMLATAVLSMWISNTATTLMMMPIGLSVVRQLQDAMNKDIAEQPVFGKALMLSIAYAASIGGIATLIGTPTNVILSAMVKQLFDYEITFSDWFLFAFPLSAILLIFSWLYLVHIAFPLKYVRISGGDERLRRQLEAMGPLSEPEKRVLWVFITTALAWMLRSYLLVKWIPGINDTVIALIGAIMLFIIPSGQGGEQRLLHWEDAVKLPWGIILLFGGGLALAAGFKDSGLALWLGERMHTLHDLPYVLLILMVIAAVNFLTEITSNVATASVILPVLAALAQAIHMPPLGLMVAATVAASCAFMLPVATPPNAVVFGSGEISMSDMVRAGLRMNFISIAVVTVYILLILSLVWEPDMGKSGDKISLLWNTLKTAV